MANKKPFYEYYEELFKLAPYPHLSGICDVGAPKEIRELLEKHDCNIFDISHIVTKEGESNRRYICTITHVPTGRTYLATESHRDIALVVVAIQFVQSGVIDFKSTT